MNTKFQTKSFITHEGITLSARGWAERLGVSIQTIHVRLKRGKTPETGLFEVGKAVSKSDGELALNDMDLKELPKLFQKLVKQEGYGSSKWGNWIRSHYPQEFDKWFREEFKTS